LSHKQRV